MPQGDRVPIAGTFHGLLVARRRDSIRRRPMNPERLRLSVEVRTGSEFDENSGTIKRLTQAEWLKRQARLWEKFGGPCDVRTWDQVSEAEMRQLGMPPKTDASKPPKGR